MPFSLDGFAPALTTNRDELDADVFCGFSSTSGQGGFCLDPNLMARLVALNLPLTLDLYAPKRHDA